MARTGFDGLDITVRKGGHVEPERVRENLPGLVAILRDHGVDVPMVTTDIVDPDTPFTENIVRTISELGIRFYRFMPSAGFKYMADQPYAAQLAAYRPRIARLGGPQHQISNLRHITRTQVVTRKALPFGIWTS